MSAGRFESVVYIQPACPARLAAAMFRRAFWLPILTRPPIRATQAWTLLQMCVKTFSQQTNIELFSGHEPLTKSNRNFPLELRAKTSSLSA